MDALIVFTARYLIILLPLVLLQMVSTLPSKEKFRFVMLSLFSLAFAYIIAKIGTHLYTNPRPFAVGAFAPLVPSGIPNGFPSLHTTFAATMALLIATERRMLGVALFAVAILIGVARVAAGVHHGIDVIAGLAVAGAAVFIARRLLRIRVYR